MKKHILRILAFVLVLCLLCGCSDLQNSTKTSKSDDIVILFTNDIHCYVEQNISISKVAAYRNYMKTKTDHVILVDCGDAIQGSGLGSVTKGEFYIDVMNEVGYDYAVFGNHEFDFGQERLLDLVSKAKAQYLCCNITYSGSGETALSKAKPYEIVQCGDTSVALVGVTTPRTILDSTYTNFLEDGQVVFDFCGGENDDKLAECVQKNVDEAREQGADYVILLAHMGLKEGMIFSSDRLIQQTNGIDAVLDGHTHDTYTKVSVENKDGDPVLLAQTGTELSNLGQLVITQSGLITITMIDELTEDDEEVNAKIAALSAEYDELFNTVVAHSDTALSDLDENGNRAVRNRETGIGDLCADAVRTMLDADISYVNGGGVRAGLPEGEITYQDIIDVHPFGNMLCVVEVTGAEILDMLEYFVQSVEPETTAADLSAPVGENGSFPCMSGITFTVDTHTETPVVVDANNALVSIDETKPRRVSDVQILSGDSYEPIDPAKTYTFASSDYVILNGGCGMQNLLDGHTVTKDRVMADFEALINYIEVELEGSLSAYETPLNRINFIR